MAKSKKKSYKKSGGFTTIIAVIAAIVYMVFFSPMSERTEKVQLDGTLQVHMIDVGQGDSFLVVSPEGETMLIDAGTNNSEPQLKSYLDSQGISEITYAVFTHPHEDHIGGADMVLNNYTVKNVILPDVTHTSATFERMIEAIDKNNINTIIPSPGDKYDLGSASFLILGPVSTNYEELNDYSIVMRLDYGGTSFMMTGDAETLSEKEMLGYFPASEFKCDVLKMGHHGSSTSSCDEFLNAVSADIALISSGKDNDYGHPHREIVSEINNRGMVSYNTADHGNIVLKADGSTITVME